MWESLGTVALAGIGAFVANLVAKIIESWVRRSQSIETQRDVDLQEMLDAIKRMGELCEKFWTKSAVELGPEDQILRSHIQALQHHIAELNATLFTDVAKRNCDIQLHKLAVAATGGFFGEPDRQEEPGRLTEILIAGSALSREVKKARRNLPRRFMS